MIRIKSIAIDRQSCIDEFGNKHSLKEIDANRKDYNVYVRNNTGINNKNSRIIVYKPNNKGRIGGYDIPKSSIQTVTYIYGNGKNTDINIVIEDSSSAFNIISNIVNYFAVEHKIKLTCKYIKARGYGNIPDALNYYVDNKPGEKIIVLYDTGINDMTGLNHIRTIIEFKNATGGTCIGIQPLCIEELLITFDGLIQDIKGLSKEHLSILLQANKYLKGIKKSLLEYNIQDAVHTIGSIPVVFGKRSKYIKKYTSIKTEEQYVADKLAEITYRNPYMFLKKSCECWDCNCMLQGYACVLEKSLGSRHKNSAVLKCNMTYMNKDKTESIIKNSLMGIIYDALGEMIFGNRQGIVNMDIYKDKTWR